MPPNARGGRLAALSALVAAAVVHPGQSASSASPPIVLDGHITLAHRDAIVSLAEHSDLYMCSHFPLQSLSAQGPLAVTHIAPHLPSATSAKAVHHVTIYACTDVSRLNAPPYAPFDCTARPFKQGCERMLYTWNDGMLPFELPEGKAMVMPTHALLQIHYKHPGESAAPWKMSDSSGMRMRVVPLTKGLRTYQFFELGPRFLMLAIPPHHPRYKAASVCAPSCIEAALGRHGYSHFEVISVNQHMHLAGSRVVTEVVHPNGSSTPFGAYPHFDFHKARMDMLPEPVIIRPGDALQVRVRRTRRPCLRCSRAARASAAGDRAVLRPSPRAGDVHVQHDQPRLGDAQRRPSRHGDVLYARRRAAPLSTRARAHPARRDGARVRARPSP